MSQEDDTFSFVKERKPKLLPIHNSSNLNVNQRLPSINGLFNRLNGISTNRIQPIVPRTTAPLTNNQLTRGGISKRVFKPNIPLKVDRSKEDDHQSEQPIDQSTVHEKESKPRELRKNDKNRKAKEFIQIEATFEGFKTEAKSKSNYPNGFVSSQSGGGSAVTSSIKVEDGIEKRIKLEDNSSGIPVRTARTAREEDYLSDGCDDDMKLDEKEQPISWSNYSKMINELNELNHETTNIEEKIENGRLVLVPCIFGNVTGHTGYKIQVLKSGKMRLVDKKSGFTIDLLNNGKLEYDAMREVVEFDNDQLFRYGSLKNSDIYSPVRSPNSNYNSILQA